MKNDIPEFPERIVLEFTPKCNLVCPMCPGKYIQERTGFMNEDLWLRLLNEIKNNNPNAVILPFWRGESLLHPDFCRLMTAALERSLRIHISTNGEISGDERMNILMRCEFVTFSVHTRRGYEHALDFISARTGKSPTVQISFVEGEATVECIMADAVKDKGLKGFDSVRLYQEHTLDGVFGHGGLKDVGVRKFCGKLQDTFVVSFDGYGSRCNHIWKPESGINLNEMGIKDAWNSSSMARIRDGYPDNMCLPCDQWLGHTRGEAWRMSDGEVLHTVYS